MAGTNANEMAIWKQLQDVTECCVCNETYKDPKILPCIHTFCRTCLEELACKTSKSPGEQMPCPICRKEFTIPLEGHAALQKNFFMEKLLAMAKIAGPSECSDHCKTCMKVESKSSVSASEVSFLDKCCPSCHRKLCQECWGYHIHNKLTRSLQVASAADSKCEVQIIVPSNCIKHNKELDLFCSDCKELVCKSCFGEGHQNHRLQIAENVVEGFKEEIKDILSGLDICLYEVCAKKELLNDRVEEYCNSLDSLKVEVLAQTDATMKLVSEHSNLVMKEIDQIKVVERKNANADIENCDEDLICLEAFKAYCTKVMTKGSATDICCTINELKERFYDCKKMHEVNIELKSSLPQLSFRMSDLEELVLTGGYNIIGTIQESQTEIVGEFETHAADKISCDGDIKMEGDCRRPISGKNDILAKMNHLTQELENERCRICGLEMEKKILENRIRELELGMKMPLKSTFSDGQGSPTSQPLAKEVPQPRNPTDYRRHPNLVKTMQRGDQSLDQGKIFGVTVVGDELFLGCFSDVNDCSVVEAYDIKTFDFIRRWLVKSRSVSGVARISCLASCKIYKCLYARICFNRSFAGCLIVQRTDVNGSYAKEWKLKGRTFHSNISVTDEGNVIAFNDAKSLIEYSRNGEVLHEVRLGIEQPLHALKLADGNFVISHGLHKDCVHRVIILSASGQILKSFGEMSVSGVGLSQVAKTTQFNEPKVLTEPSYLTIDSLGNILVADRGNDRIIALNLDLELNNILYPSLPLYHPSYLAVDHNRRLFVCEGMKKISVLISVNASIVMFNLVSR